MARVLEQFPEHISRPDGKYPWSDWANGAVWELEHGVDFEASVSSFRQTCAKKAARMGQPSPRTAVQRDGDRMLLIVQFQTTTTTAPGRRRATRAGK